MKNFTFSTLLIAISITCGSFFVAYSACPPPPIIDSYNTSVTVCKGGSAQFGANARFYTSIKWQMKSPSGAWVYVKNGDMIGGSKINIINLILGIFPAEMAVNNYSFRIILYDSNGDSAVSSPGVLTVVEPAVITTQPPDTILLCEGQDTCFTGAGKCVGAGTETYQWMKYIQVGAFYQYVPLDASDGPYFLNTNTSTLCIDNASQSMLGGVYLQVSCSGCSVYSDITRIFVSPGVSITTHPKDSVLCAGSNATFKVTATGALLKYQWQVNTGSGFVDISNSGVYSNATTATLMITGATSAMDGYKYRCKVYNDKCGSQLSNSATITVKPNPPVSMTISASATSICVGGTVNFTATPVNGGTAPTFSWRRVPNTILPGGTSSTYSSSTLTNGTKIYCLITSNEPCALKTPFSSDTITITVNSIVAASVTMSMNPTGTICPGTQMNFTATPGSGIVSSGYVWKVNSVTQAGTGNVFSTVQNSSGTYTVTCEMNSAAACVTGLPATATRTFTVTPSLAASVTISASSNPICTGASITFSATPVNGGVPTYQWRKNGTDIPGATRTTYTSAGWVDGDKVVCIMNSTATCATGSPASDTIVVNISTSQVASVTISSDVTTVCPGGIVTFTATPVNGGSPPSYQWRSGVPPGGTNIAGQTNSTYSAPFNSNASIYCVMTSNANAGACLTGSPASSGAISVMVTTNLTPSVTISSSATSICTGTKVDFTATPVNGGSTPTISWRMVGSGSSLGSGLTYSSSSLVNGAKIYCILTSTDPCASKTPVNSDTILITVSANSTPSVTISNTPAGVLCEGSAISYTATASNAGTPTYQWYNGSTTNPIAGATNQIYTSDTIKTGTHSIFCEIVSNLTCVTTPKATSTSKSLTITPSAQADVVITSSATNVCSGVPVTFSATPTNGGAAPTYKWTNSTGVIPGATASTYTSSFLSDDTISCIMTSNFTPCLKGSPDTSNQIIITVTANQAANVTITVSKKSICTGEVIDFTATPEYGGTPAYQWYNGATPIAGETNETYSTAGLANGDIISCEMTSSLSCVTGSPTTSKPDTITVSTAVPASVNISSTNPSVCQGTSIEFTATAVNGGASPSYEWLKNGTPIVPAETDSIFNSSSLVTGDEISCVMTSGLGCVSNSPDTSNIITVTVSQTVAAKITISASKDTICLNSNVDFTASPENEGANPTYQWYNGVVPIPGATNVTYSSTTINDGDTISCVMASSLTCVTGSPDTSNLIIVAVLPDVTASVTISGSPDPICEGDHVVFSATPVNGGKNPVYQWIINSKDVAAATNQVYETDTLHTGDVIELRITSNQQCVTNSLVTSSPLNLTVNPVLNVSVNISANVTFPVCAGTLICFTATPLNGGTPTYVWKVDGVAQSGFNDSVFCKSDLTDGQEVEVEMTTSMQCALPQKASSNKITADVSPTLTASVSISPKTVNICVGNNVDFTAIPVNGGTTPSYQWQINGVDTSGQTQSTFSTNNLKNGDIVTVVMTSGITCVVGSPAMSDSVKADVGQNDAAAVSITSSPNPVCENSTISFTAAPVNGGSATYQWRINDTPVSGATNGTFSRNNLSDQDSVDVIMTSGLLCVTNSPAYSNHIVVTVTPTNTVSATISSSSGGGNICSGMQVCFTATPVNGGTAPSYQWTIGGNPAPGATNDSVYCYSGFNNNDEVKVVLTSNINCPSGSPATSNGIKIQIMQSVVPSVSITSSPAVVCPNTTVNFTTVPINGGNPVYQWFLNSNPVGSNSNIYTNSTLNSGDSVWVVMTPDITCVTTPTATSNKIGITVTPSVTATVSISASANPVCEGLPISFTATPTNEGTSPTYQWIIDGGTPIAGSSVYSSVLPASPSTHTVSVSMTSSANCVLNSPLSSNTVNVTVTPTTNVSVTASASSLNICEGASVTFSAIPTNPGSQPVYEWFVNGTSQSNSNSDVFSTAGLSSGNNSVEVHLTSDAVCPSPVPAKSTAISVSVVAYSSADVSITTASPTVCDGASVSFTANPVNGGTTPTYNWKVNGVNAGTGQIINITPTDGDTVTCEMTSGLMCVNNSPATSSPIVMSVKQFYPVSVTISNSVNNICGGTKVDFTATAVNGGATPVYQWQINGIDVPNANDSVFSSTTLNDKDIVTCKLTSSIKCVTNSPAISDSIEMAVTPVTTASVNITSSKNIVCVGETVDFSAVATNGGNNTTYQWKLGGTDIPGETNDTYTASGFQNGAVFSCEITSDKTCVTGSPAMSNTITLQINMSIVPDIKIATPVTAICSGVDIVLTSTIKDGGTSPGYQWMINGSPVNGANNPDFTSNSIADGDILTCVLTSDAYCATTPTDTSNSISFDVTPTPVITISTDVNSSCYGSPVQLEATGADSYKWTPDKYLTCASCPSPTANPLRPVTYVVTGANGDCIAEDSVSIDIQCLEIFVPTGFTPNNDFMNDQFLIYGPFIYNFNMKIFNRWGELLFESHDQSVGWDGTYHNQPMPPGVYIWTVSGTDYFGNKITRNGRKGTISGDVMLIR